MSCEFPNFDTWRDAVLAQTERRLGGLLDGAPTSGALAQLHQGMRYAVLDGGKRIRPLLAHAAGELTVAPTAALDRVACAVELIHAYSLVHDDMPCMDNDVLRRGKPTVHVAFGEALAMLVGDALQALAFRAVAESADCGVPAAAVVKMTLELADAAGASGMAGGQAIDLGAVGSRLSRTMLEDMHARKTGAMLRAAVRLGAWCGEPLSESGQHALDRYSAAIGLAFQVVDDVLDVASDSATLGKTVGKDAAQAKPTYVSLLGLGGARALAAGLREQALSALESFGQRADKLAALADVIVVRDF